MGAASPLNSFLIRHCKHGKGYQQDATVTSRGRLRFGPYKNCCTSLHDTTFTERSLHVKPWLDIGTASFRHLSENDCLDNLHMGSKHNVFTFMKVNLNYSRFHRWKNVVVRLWGANSCYWIIWKKNWMGGGARPLHADSRLCPIQIITFWHRS